MSERRQFRLHKYSMACSVHGVAHSFEVLAHTAGQARRKLYSCIKQNIQGKPSISVDDPTGDLSRISEWTNITGPGTEDKTEDVYDTWEDLVNYAYLTVDRTHRDVIFKTC